MLEYVSSETDKLLERIDFGLQSSMKNIQYPLVIAVLYIGLFALLIQNHTSTVFYISILLILASKILLFSILSVETHNLQSKTSVENPLLNPSQFLKILIAGSILTGIIFTSGILFVLPGIYLGYRFSLTIPLISINNESIISSFIISWNQTKGETIQLIVSILLTSLLIGFFFVGFLGSFLLAIETTYIGSSLSVLFLLHLGLYESCLYCTITAKNDINKL